MRRLDYPACDYDPDAELVEDDRRLDLGLEPCRALVHERQCWWLRPWRLWGARMGFAVPQTSDTFGRHTWDALGAPPESLAEVYWGDEVPF